MATAYLYYEPRTRPLSSTTLTVIPNATLTFYYSGTTNLAPIYASSTTTGAQLPNPITADGSGLFPVIYVDPNITYRTILKNSSGTTLEDTDPAVEYQPIISQAQTTIASAGLTDLGTAGSNNVFITGTTTINSFGSSASINAPIYFLRFAGVLTLTNSTNLQLPGGANVTTQANDTAIAQYFGTGTWQVMAYNRAGAATSGSFSQLTVGAPGSGIALTVNGALGSAAATINPNGSSPGLAIAGTSTNNASISLQSAGKSAYQFYAAGAADEMRLYNGTTDLLKVSTAGNWTYAAPTSGATGIFTTTSGSPIRCTDGTVILDVQINSGTSYIGTASNHNLNFITNNTTKTSLSTAGNWAMAAPSSGIGLTINGAAASNALQINYPGATSGIILASTAATSCYQTWVRNSVTVGDAGDGQGIVGGSGADFGISSRAGQLILGQNSQAVITITTNRTTNIGAANANNPTLVVNGSASTPVNNIGNSGTAFTVDCSKSNVHAVTMTGNVPAGSMTISNMQDGQTINLYITQDATGSRTLGNATGVKWPGGTVGVLSTAPNSLDMITFQKQNSIITATIIKAFS